MSCRKAAAKVVSIGTLAVLFSVALSTDVAFAAKKGAAKPCVDMNADGKCSFTSSILSDIPLSQFYVKNLNSGISSNIEVRLAGTPYANRSIVFPNKAITPSVKYFVVYTPGSVHFSGTVAFKSGFALYAGGDVTIAPNSKLSGVIVGTQGRSVTVGRNTEIRTKGKFVQGSSGGIGIHGGTGGVVVEEGVKLLGENGTASVIAIAYSTISGDPAYYPVTIDRADISAQSLKIQGSNLTIFSSVLEGSLLEVLGINAIIRDSHLSGAFKKVGKKGSEPTGFLRIAGAKYYQGNRKMDFLDLTGTSIEGFKTQNIDAIFVAGH